MVLPQADVPLHAYSNGTSSHSRQDNWDQIKKVAQRKSLPIPKDLIEGTMKVIWMTVVCLHLLARCDFSSPQLSRLPALSLSFSHVAARVPRQKVQV